MYSSFRNITHLTHKTDNGGENWSVAVFYNTDAHATIKYNNNKHVGLTANLSHILTVGVCNIYTNNESGGFALKVSHLLSRIPVKTMYQLTWK